MSRERLIIEIDGTRVTGALYSADAIRIGEAESVGYGTEDGLCGAVEELLTSIADGVKESGFSATGIKESVYLSISPGLLSFRILELPLKEKRKVVEVLPLELSGMLGVDTDDAVLDAVMLGADRVLAVAIEKPVLRSMTRQLKEAGVEPVWIGSALFAASFITSDLMATDKEGGTRVVVGPGFIAATAEEDGRPLFYNSIPPDGNCSASIEYLKGLGIEFDSVLLVGLDSEEVSALFDQKRYNIKVKEFNEEGAGGKGNGWPVLLNALASQITANRLSENVNFAQGEFEYKRGRKRARAKLRITAALAIVLFTLIGVDLYLRYARYSGALSSINRSMALSYKEVSPAHAGGAVNDPLYLLQAKMKQIETESSQVAGISPLTVLRLLTSAANGLGTGEIKISSASIAQERVTATGNALTFEAANRYKEALAALSIGTVRMAEVKSRADDKVDFSLTILR